MAPGALRRGAPAVLLAVAALAAEIAVPAGTLPLAVLDVTVAVAYSVGAAAALDASRSAGMLGFCVATTWAVGTVAGAPNVSTYLADTGALLHRAPLALLILTYPERSPRGAVAWGIACAAVVAPFLPGTGGTLGTAVVFCLLATVVWARALRAPSSLRPPEVAAALVATAVAAIAVLGATDAAPTSPLLVAYDLVLIAGAAALLLPIAGHRWRDAMAAGLVIELGKSPTHAPITARLSDALHDPGLELRLLLPDGSWTDEAGHAAVAPEHDANGRSVTRQATADGTEIVLLHDADTIRSRALAESALAVAATAIDNARRDREVQVRLGQLHRLRRALLDTADEERRQLEAELRSGPLREITQLDLAVAGLPGDEIDRLRRELSAARRELEEIARGLHPRVLSERGLAGALEQIQARAPIPVSVRSTLGDAGIPPDVGLTAYYVIAEALANTSKHARARSACVDLREEGQRLRVRVTDDGIGGADPSGNGLSGLSARVRANGGALRISSPPGAGTTLDVSLPLNGG